MVYNEIGSDEHVSVYGNASKAWGALLTELHALIDHSKVTLASRVEVTVSDGAGGYSVIEQFIMAQILPGPRYVMSLFISGAGSCDLHTISFTYNAATYYVWSTKTNGNVVTAAHANRVPSGYTLSFYYR